MNRVNNESGGRWRSGGGFEEGGKKGLDTGNMKHRMDAAWGSRWANNSGDGEGADKARS